MNMIDHTHYTAQAWSFDSANDNAKCIQTTAIVSILQLLFYYRDSIAIVKSPAIVII